MSAVCGCVDVFCFAIDTFTSPYIVWSQFPHVVTEIWPSQPQTPDMTLKPTSGQISCTWELWAICSICCLYAKMPLGEVITCVILALEDKDLCCLVWWDFSGEKLLEMECIHVAHTLVDQISM